VPPIEATANLAEHDAVRAVTQSRLQQIPDFNARKGILGASGPEANQVWVCEPNLGGVLNEGNEDQSASLASRLRLEIKPHPQVPSS
jgi:hypothetical protein